MQEEAQSRRKEEEEEGMLHLWLKDKSCNVYN